MNTGTINTGQFMRDLVYTANVDAVSNVLGGPGGGQDGYTSGRLSGFNFSGDGTIVGRYTNGQSATLGQQVVHWDCFFSRCHPVVNSAGFDS